MISNRFIVESRLPLYSYNNYSGHFLVSTAKLRSLASKAFIDQLNALKNLILLVGALPILCTFFPRFAGLAFADLVYAYHFTLAFEPDLLLVLRST